MHFDIIHRYTPQAAGKYSEFPEGAFKVALSVKVSSQKTSFLPGGTVVACEVIPGTEQESYIEFFSIKNDIHLHFLQHECDDKITLEKMHIRNMGYQDLPPRCMLYLHLHENRPFYFPQFDDFCRNYEAEGGSLIHRMQVPIGGLTSELSFY